MDNISETIDLLTRKFKRALYGMRDRSRKKGLTCEVTFDDLRDVFFKQEGKCFYSGLPFDFGDPLGTISVDRVDNTQGYTKDNIVWCRFGVNSLKSSRSYDELIEICKTLVFYKPDWKVLND